MNLLQEIRRVQMPSLVARVSFPCTTYTSSIDSVPPDASHCALSGHNVVGASSARVRLVIDPAQLDSADFIHLGLVCSLTFIHTINSSHGHALVQTHAAAQFVTRHPQRPSRVVAGGSLHKLLTISAHIHLHQPAHLSVLQHAQKGT